MDAIQDLLQEIQLIQCLVCACRRDEAAAEGGVLPTRELIDLLRIPPTECRRVVTTLTARGLFESVPDPEHPLPRGVRLTDTGRDYLRRWSSSIPARRPLA